MGEEISTCSLEMWNERLEGAGEPLEMEEPLQKIVTKNNLPET